MNILPSLVEGYMYSEMYHLEGGRMSGGFPLQSFVEMSDSTDMVGGGNLCSAIQLAHYVVPIGLVCDMRVGPTHIHYNGDISYSDKVIDDRIHDILYEKIGRTGSRKKLMRNPSKNKSVRVKN
jgi:hypothetical protein